MEGIFAYFTDPVLRGPTVGSMLMCFSASLVGVIAFLRRQSLLGEALSHAAYPGVIIGVMIAVASMAGEHVEWIAAFWILLGAGLSALLGLLAIRFLERVFRIRTDSAFCFVISVFFGVGVTLASRAQFTHASLYNRMQGYLYGQAATMTDFHIWLYGGLALFVVLFIVLFHKEIYLFVFDQDYARSLGIPVRVVESLIALLMVLAVVVGMRSVGVVLMSAMLIAPGAAARQWSNHLAIIFLVAGFFGLLSGFLGTVSSSEISAYLLAAYPEDRLVIPTGPMIVLVSSLLCVLSLLLAPERGLLLRGIRAAHFRYRRVCENVLKGFWRNGPEKSMTLKEVSSLHALPWFYLMGVLFQLKRQGWLKQTDRHAYQLTHEGEQWAAQIVRLHRLWEVYLCDYVGIGAERVHRNAEEMEHILTPELEKELTLLLHNPQKDPHHQPIPPKEVL